MAMKKTRNPQLALPTVTDALLAASTEPWRSLRPPLELRIDRQRLRIDRLPAVVIEKNRKLRLVPADTGAQVLLRLEPGDPPVVRSIHPSRRWSSNHRWERVQAPPWQDELVDDQGTGMSIVLRPAPRRRRWWWSVLAVFPLLPFLHRHPRPSPTRPPIARTAVSLPAPRREPASPIFPPADRRPTPVKETAGHPSPKPPMVRQAADSHPNFSTLKLARLLQEPIGPTTADQVLSLLTAGAKPERLPPDLRLAWRRRMRIYWRRRLADARKTTTNPRSLSELYRLLESCRATGGDCRSEPLERLVDERIVPRLAALRTLAGVNPKQAARQARALARLLPPGHRLTAALLRLAEAPGAD